MAALQIFERGSRAVLIWEDAPRDHKGKMHSCVSSAPPFLEESKQLAIFSEGLLPHICLCLQPHSKKPQKTNPMSMLELRVGRRA
eukprot:431625-Pelagomonas_calceolata.AAC.1